jgi:serine/threonine protein kinase
MQDLTGRAWGRFQIIEERGRGGMAIVYKAYDGVLQRTVALKVLLPLLSSNTEFVQRFRREAITAANLRHPNIVVIYDVGSHEDYQYIVMEYLEGQTLQQEIDLKGVMPLERTVSILGQLTEALEYAHQQHLVHRDIKPANIIVGAQDRVTLTDFGLVKAASRSRITGEGVAVGTLKYMSPEQAVGKELDYRSDLYSLGVVVYEMLTGRTPFTGGTPYQALHELIYEPPVRPSTINPRMDPGVERALLQALSKEPDSRYARAGAFAQAMALASGLRPSQDWGGQTEMLSRQVVLRLLAADGREYPVYWGRVTIGRDTDNDVVIPDRQVSRHHALIQCGSRGCTVTDRGSTNGTLINGVRIQPEMPWPLRQEDVLQLGSVQLLVALPVSADADAAGTTMTMPADFEPGTEWQA